MSNGPTLAQEKAARRARAEASILSPLPPAQFQNQLIDGFCAAANAFRGFGQHPSKAPRPKGSK